jgi:hypothetical protein
MSEVKLTRSIPLSIILGLIVQTGAFIWFLSRLDSRVEANTEKINRQTSLMNDREAFEDDITAQMIRLTMTAEQLSKSSERLAATVDKLSSQVLER